MRRTWKILASLATGLVLAGCAVGPNMRSPHANLPLNYSEGNYGSNGDVTNAAWWYTFSDDLLNQLVQKGLSQNLNVLQALQTIEQARQNVTASSAGLFPSINASASGTAKQDTSGIYRTYQGGVSASWVIDLFGQYRRSRESARASLDAAYAGADVARLTLISDLVSHYVAARYYQRLMTLAQTDLKSRHETLRLTRARMQAGAASRLDVVQAEGQVNATKSDIPALEINYRKAVHRMSTLLGLPAATLIATMDKAAPQPVAHDMVKLGIPADLIRNRPDIRKAEYELAAAVANIGVAEAQLYPSLQLSGTISPTAIISSSATTRLNTWSFGPVINLPIFEGGRLRANVKSAESKAHNAYLVWKQTVLNAIEETENALVAYNRDQRTISSLTSQVRSYEDAVKLSNASYKRGLGTMLTVLDSQRSLSSARQSLASAVHDASLNYIMLNIALGGGYRAAN